MRKPVVVRSLLVMLLACLTALAAACSSSGSSSASSSASSKSAPLTTVKYIQATDTSVYWPIYVAIHEGYFTQEGIKLDRLPNIANAAQLSEMASAGEVDVAGVGTTGAYSVIAAGRPLSDIAILASRPLLYLVLSKSTVAKLKAEGITADSSIADRVKALKGLTLATGSQGTITDVLLRATLKAYGLNPDKDVTIVPVSDPTSFLTSLDSGRIAGYEYGSPTSSEAIVQGNADLWIDYGKGEISSLADIATIDLVASKSFAGNTDVAKRFLAAIWKAVDLIKTDPTEALSVTHSDPAFSEMNAASFNAAFQGAEEGFADGLIPTESSFQATLALANKAAQTPLKLTFSQVYNTALATQSQP